MPTVYAVGIVVLGFLMNELSDIVFLWQIMLTYEKFYAIIVIHNMQIMCIMNMRNDLYMLIHVVRGICPGFLLNQEENKMGNQSNGLAIGALICGILGIVGSWIPVVCYFTLVLAIVGIVLGVKGRKNAEMTGNGKGLATAGLVLGIIGTVFGLAGVICAIVCVGIGAAAGAFQ